MKKVIFLSLAIILGLSFTMVAPLSANETSTSSNSANSRVLAGGRERILTPAHICLYDEIVRHGNTLFGVKKSTTTISQMSTTTCPAAKPISDKFNRLSEKTKTATRQLERIAAPWFLHQYEQIRRVGTALWGFKKEMATSSLDADVKPGPSKTSKIQAHVSPETAACVISAIKVKDLALINSNSSSTEVLNKAISTRTLCQETAINLTTSSMATSTATSSIGPEQKKKLLVCNEAFRESFATIREAFKNSRQVIWETYRNSLKICQPATTENPDLIIEDGGSSLFN